MTAKIDQATMQAAAQKMVKDVFFGPGRMAKIAQDGLKHGQKLKKIINGEDDNRK